MNSWHRPVVSSEIEMVLVPELTSRGPHNSQNIRNYRTAAALSISQRLQPWIIRGCVSLTGTPLGVWGKGETNCTRWTGGFLHLGTQRFKVQTHPKIPKKRPEFKSKRRCPTTVALRTGRRAGAKLSDRVLISIGFFFTEIAQSAPPGGPQSHPDASRLHTEDDITTGKKQEHSLHGFAPLIYFYPFLCLL